LTTNLSSQLGNSASFQSAKRADFQFPILAAPSTWSALCRRQKRRDHSTSLSQTLVFRFERDSSKLTIAQIPGLFTEKENGSYVIRIRAEAIDGTSKRSLQRVTITGRGVSTKSWEQAIQEAVQELSDNLSGLLMTDFGMPLPPPELPAASTL
jgi:hypothetical protein